MFVLGCLQPDFRDAVNGVSLKSYAKHALAPADWFTPKVEDLYWILDAVEFKTAWHPMGL
jgi:hypothetical protein